MKTLVILGLFFLLLAAKVPVAFSMLGASVISCIVFDLAPVTSIASAALNSLYSYPLLAIPFYIFAGNIMTNGGISRKLCNWISTVFGRFTGGLGMVTVVASAFFAALSGSASATTASIGSMMVPEMERDGYRKPYALGIAAAGGVIGPVIPPSIMFVLYGVAVEASIGDLFIGGIIPGILMAGLLCAAVYFTARREGLKPSLGHFKPKDFFHTLWLAKWAVLVPVIILGGIYSGVFTPTEAGAVACIYAIIVSLFIERTLSLKGIIRCAAESGVTSATVLLLIGCAGVLGKVFTLAGVPAQLLSLLLTIAKTKFMALLLINILLLLVGCVMDGGAALVIFAPLLWPVAQTFGMSIIQFGIMICLNLSIAAITPPVGSSLFVATIIGNTPMEKVTKEILPFLLSEVLVLVLVSVIPWLTVGLLG